MAKAKAVHVANAEGKNVCSYKVNAPVVSNDVTEVTCKRCLSKLVKDADA